MVGSGVGIMNIFEYIDKKRNEYETLRDESQIQLKSNLNRIETISSQIRHMTEEEENPSKFFLPETAENYEKEIVELQEKINILELENFALSEKIAYCDDELHLLDILELPDFESAEKNIGWMPMMVSEEEFQKKNVSRETILKDEEKANVSRETFDPLQAEALFAEGFNETVEEIKDFEQLILNVSRETFSGEESDNLSTDDFDKTPVEASIPKLNLIKEKILFCRQISELDPHRCRLLLDEIINEI